MDSVAGSFASTCHVFLLISWLLAVVASGAPDLRQSVATSAPGTEYMLHEQPWLYPCGSLTPEQEDDMSKILKLVLLELRIVYFNKSISQFEAYSEEPTKNLHISHSSRLNWLPNKSQLTCFYREICNLEKQERRKAVHILPHLYNMLQKFDITFFALKQFQYDEIEPIVQGEGGNKVTLKKKRQEFFLKLHTYNLQIMCEVQRGIQKLKLKEPEAETIDLVLGNPHYKNRSNQMTDMILQDKGVLAMYKTFLHEWMRIIRAIRQPSRCPPLTMRNQTNQTFKQVGKERGRAYSSTSPQHVQRFRHYIQHAARRRPNANQESMKNLHKRTKNPRLGLTNNYTGEQNKRRRRGRVLIRQRLKMIGKKCKRNI